MGQLFIWWKKVSWKEVSLIIIIGFLFISCVLVVSDLQTKEDTPQIIIINETYESPHIHRHPIKKNRTTIMIVEPIN